jgi:superfamily II DNA or RNA helicase
MKFVLRDPRAAYLDTWLWLPKAYWSVGQLQAALRYENPRNGELLDVFYEAAEHYRVPRNFLSWETLGKLPYPVIDTRFRDFPEVEFNSRVMLDAKEPSQTYQRDGSRALLSVWDGILTLRCGAGKTVVGLHTAAQTKNPILIVVQDKGLARQWMEEIEQFLGIPEKEVGRVGGDGSPFNWEHKICIAIVNSLALRVQERTLPREMTKHFGTILLDEAHTMGAPFFNTAIPPFHGRRWGLSATPVREDGFDSLLRYTMGDVVYEYLTPDLKPTVFFRSLPTILNLTDKEVVAATHDSTGELHFGKLYDHFASLSPRVATIASDVKLSLKQGRQILILTHSRAMCEVLAERLPGAGVVHGGVKEGERLRRIKEHNPVIAIMRLGKQALNKPSLDTLFVCEPFRKEAMLQQCIGRILRAYEGKQSPSAVFYEDSQIEPMFKMCNRIRRSLYHWPAKKGGRIPYFNK